ncbi:MAG: SHOCT domain-containing protein [Phycisphaerae bacterium]|nr:SHOCT domain-containing protein [Phycisphaerae bacterium]
MGNTMSHQNYILCVWDGQLCLGILLVFLVGLLGYLVGQAQNSTSNDPTDLEAPIVALKKRYARGEITRDEFEQARKNITKQGERP